MEESTDSAPIDSGSSTGMDLLGTAGNIATGYYLAGGFGSAATAASTAAAAGMASGSAALASAGTIAPAMTSAVGTSLSALGSGLTAASGTSAATAGLGSSMAAAGSAASSAGAAASSAAAGAGSAFMAAIPWLAAAAIVYSLVSGRKKTVHFRRYNELPRFDLQADRRGQQDKYTPMFLSGTSSRQPWQPGSPIQNTSGYELNSGPQMLGGRQPNFAGLGGVRAGYVKPVTLGPGNWSGYQATTDYGSRAANFVERAAGMEQTSMRVKKKKVGSTVASMEAQGWKRI